MQKREINEELIDVWYDIVSNKMYEAQKKLEEYERENRPEWMNWKLRGYIDACAETVTMMSCLEQGRFKKLYNETLEKIKKEDK